MRKFLLLWVVMLLASSASGQAWHYGQTGWKSEQSLWTSFIYEWTSTTTVDSIPLDIQMCSERVDWRFDPSVYDNNVLATFKLLGCPAANSIASECSLITQVPAGELIEADESTGKSERDNYTQLQFGSHKYIMIDPTQPAGGLRKAQVEIVCKQKAKPEFAYDALHEMGMRTSINNFMQREDSQVPFTCVDVFTAPVCAMPIVAQTSSAGSDGFCDASCLPRSAGKLGGNSIGGAHGLQLNAYGLRTTPPFLGIVAVRFRGSSTNNQGYHWYDIGNYGPDFYTMKPMGALSPFEIEWFATVGWEIPTGAATYLGLGSPTKAPLETDGSLDVSDSPDPTAQSYGFYINATGDIFVVAIDSEFPIFIIDTGLNVVEDLPYRLRVKFIISALSPDSNLLASNRTCLQYFINDQVIRDTCVSPEQEAIAFTPGLVPSLASVRISGNMFPIVTQWGYGLREVGTR